jgi:hypothetical protein
MLITASMFSFEGEVTVKSVVVPLDGSELAESVLPTVAELAKKLSLEVVLFRAYNIPYNAYASAEGYAAIDYEELLASMREEAVSYLEKKVEAVKKMGVNKVSCIVKEGFAADEIIATESKTPVSLIAM